MRRNVFAGQLAQASASFRAVEGNSVDWFTIEGEIGTSPLTVGLVKRIRICRRE